jgi:subtilase family serine protease
MEDDIQYHNNNNYSFKIDPVESDLNVSNITLPNPVTWGEEIAVNWTVGNTGGRAVKGWNNKIYLSSDATFDNNDTLLSNFNTPATTVVAPNTTYTASKNLTITTPSVDSNQSWYLFVAVDGGETQRDLDFNNNRAATSFQIIPPPYADLIVESIAAPTTANSGGQIEVNWQVKNRGNSTTSNNSWLDRLVLSSDNTIGNSDDRELTRINHVGELAAGDTYNQTATVRLPEEIAGNYRLFAVTDINNGVPEYLFENNNTNFQAIAISLKPVPDLQVTNIATVSNAQPGERITVNWTVTNNGQATATGNWKDRVYLSKNGTLTYLTDVERNSQLEADSSYNASASVILPDVADGDYQIIIATDISDRIFERSGENNNQANTTIGIAHPDLISTITNLATSATSDTTIPITWQTRNIGTAPTLKSWKEKIYLSTDNQLNAQDILLREYDRNNIEEPVTLNLDLPLDLNGSYYILLATDTDNTIRELAGENNNLTTSPINITLAAYADLAVSNVTAPALTIKDPAKVNISWRVTNQGTGRGKTDTWGDRVIASTDEIIGNSDDRVLGEYTHTGGLEVDGYYTRNETISLPPAFTGHYNLYIQTDSQGAVFENGSKTNNRSKAPNFFDVMPIPYADLRITQLQPTGNANSGQPLSVEWTVINEGIGITSPSDWLDRLYLATDPQGKNIITELGQFNRAGALGVGKSYNRAAEVTLPDGLNGEYYLVAKTGGPFEFIYNQNNTLVSAPFNVSFTPPPDLRVTDIIAPSSITSGNKIDLTWRVQNEGTGDAAGIWTDSIYLQQGSSLIPLTNYTYDGGLLAGRSYTRQEKILIPPELQGLYRVVVKTNTTNSLYEYTHTGNNTTIDDETIQITLPPRPDLQVESIVAPEEVAGGGTITVGFKVINQGVASTTTPNWADNVYLSLDNEISSDDIVLGSLTNGAALKPGENYQSTTNSLIIPKRFRGDAYIIVATDAGNAVNELPQENNNTKYKQIRVKFTNDGGGGDTSLPSDLVTSNVVAPTRAFEGSTIDVSYTVKNKGIHTTDVNSWTDTIWLTRDKNRPSPANRKNIPGEFEDILLKSVTHNGALAVDDEYRQTVTVQIPSQITGEWYITPWSDTYDVVLEDTLDININPDDPNELDNNNYKARPITLLLTPPPDLTVTSVTPTPTAKGGESFNVTWTVENKGAGETTAETWTDSIYLSNSPNLNTPGAKTWSLGDITHRGSLASGSSYTQTANFDLSPAAAGKYVIVKTNSSRPPVWEGPYGDNNTKVVSTNVISTPADLVVESIDLPQTSDSGEKITVSWTVANQGATMWSGTKYWYDEVWLSPDPTFIVDRATRLGSFIYSPDTPLATGDTYTQTKEVNLPAGIEGEYYLYISPDYSRDPLGGKFRASLDANGGDNNESRKSFVYRGFEDPSNNLDKELLPVVYREADLQITDLVIPNTPSPSGSTIPVSWTTTNLGTRATRTNSWIDRVYLSKDPSLDFHDTLLGNYSHSGYLGINSSYNASLNVKLPENISGDFYLLAFTDSNIRTVQARITKPAPYGLNPNIYYEIATEDELARVAEFQDEGNNVTEAGLEVILRDPPDLQVTAVNIPSTAVIGQNFNVSYTVQNKGIGNPTQTSWSDLIYLSRDKFLDLNSDRYLDTVPHQGGLTAGDSYSVDRTLTVPTDLSGPFYVFVITDPSRNGQGGVFEGGLDNNNSLASTQPLLLEVPPPADLEINNITLPRTALSGDNITLNWQGSNNGPNAATGNWSDAVYLSTDAVWDIEDLPLGRMQYTGTVLPGDTYSQTLQTILPPAAPGQYRIIIRPDIYNQIYEAENETNNRTASANPLNITVEELQLGVERTTTLSTGQSRLYQIDVPAGDTLQVAVDSISDSAANELFIKQGTIPTSTNYDFAYNGGLNADQTVLVPTTEPGTYYILVKGFAQPAANTTTAILAQSLPFDISNVVTDRGGDNRYVTTHIYGARFDEDAVVKFIRPGIAEYAPVNYEVIDGTHIIAIFDFTDAPHGLYDVKVINPDGEAAIAPYRYLVERSIEQDVTVGLGGPRVLAPGDTGTYGVSLQSLTNLDTPYVHFQFGIPELGDNNFLLGKFRETVRQQAGIEELPYLEFASNLRGQPEVGETADLPWASLVSDINTNGEILAPGYIYDFPTASATGWTFNAQTYPGLKDLLKLQPDALSELDPGDDARIAFGFHIQAAATVLTREEFIAEQTEAALNLRDSILKDTQASPSLALLAADSQTWIASYLAALEAAGLLRPEEEAPPVRENPLVLSMMATLASGILIGAAGEQIITDDILGFFIQLRKWYGHDETKVGEAEAPVGAVGGQGAGSRGETFDHFEAFNIYVPFGTQRLDLPPGTNVPNPSFADVDGEVNELSNILGPVGTGENGFVPVGETLPYTIQFANSPSASTSVGEIEIISELDSNLDPRSFRLGDLQLGDLKVHIPEGRGTFSGDFDFTGSKGFVLRVSAGIEPLSNTATWLLSAIDPQTGEVITNPDIGLLPPNDATGAGSGFVGYTIKPKEDLATGTAFSAKASILYNNAPPLETVTVTNTIDGAAPVTSVSVETLTEGGSDYLVKWQASDEETGSGVKHVTVYVAEDGGDFTIWQKQTTDTEGVFEGKAGKTYEFLALATDNAGNREQPDLGTNLPDDGSSTNLGTLPTVGQTSEPTPKPAAPPNHNYTTNPLFTQAKNNIPGINSSEFDSVLRPFKATSFTDNIPNSHAGIAPLAILELADGSFLISGGKNRGSLYRVEEVGGKVGTPLIELPEPIFAMEWDENGAIWATTGGGALLQLDGTTGEIIARYGDGITQALSIDPETGLIYLSSGNGIEIFDPIAETFTHFSNLRVGNLAFAPDGSLWAARWPDRGEIVLFERDSFAMGDLGDGEIGNELTNSPSPQLPTLNNKPRLVFDFEDLAVDSLAFGKDGTKLEHLLFISSNDGELLMVDLATRNYLTVADGGSRGDIIEASNDGKLLLSQSHEVTVFSPVTAPQVAYTNPADESIVALPKGSISVTFDQAMLEAGVLNPANYTLIGENKGNLTPTKVSYDAASKTVLLEFNALETDKYQLIVSGNLKSTEGISLGEDYQVDFTAVSDFSPYVDLEFTNTRSDRSNQTISFDVSLTNEADYDVLLPVNLLLQPARNNTAQPVDNLGTTDTGAYLVDLSDSLPDGILSPGESIIGHTVTIYNPDALRFEFDPAIYTLPTTNAAPVFTSNPVTVATAGETYVYNAVAEDPDGLPSNGGSVIGYLLYDAPEGMSIAPDGKITWNPTTDSPVATHVTLHAYDSRGGRAIQEFELDVTGGNHQPVFTPLAKEIKGTEGKAISLQLAATDADGNTLQYWADNLPPGATFDTQTRTFSWTPSYESAGTYEDVAFIVTDGREEVAITTTFLIASSNQAPSLLPIVPKTYLEGDAIRIQLQGSDSENDRLTYTSNLLPGGSTLNPNTGVFEWTPAFFQAGEYEIPFTVSDGKSSTTQTAKITILNVNAIPEFDNLGNWAVAEGQRINFRAFALDPDNPGFIPQERTSNGELTLLEGSEPTVSYSVTGLPEGATFDRDTAIFNWKPGFNTAGEYTVTFTATDGVKTTSTNVNLIVGNLNRPPVFTAISNQTVQRGEVLDLTVNTTDPDGDALTITGMGVGGFDLPDFVTLTDNGDNTANLHIAPVDGDRGDYTIVLTATDAGGEIKNHSFVLTVEAFNERPLLGYIGDKVAVVGEPIEFTIDVKDLDEDNLTFSATGLPAGATLTESNVYGKATFSWTPTAANLGTYPITISVEDSGNGDSSKVLNSTQSFNLVVRNSNSAPVLNAIEPQNIKEGETLSFALNATDSDGDVLTYTAKNLPNGAFLNPETGEFTWTPNYFSAKVYEGIEFIVSDGHSSSSQTVKITVTESDRSPVLTPLPLQSTRENTELKIATGIPLCLQARG